MNRQQRRAADRRRSAGNPRSIDPMAAWAVQQIAMLKTDQGDVPEDEKSLALIPTYQCLNKLQYGNMDKGDFLHLCEWNGVAGEIAFRLQDQDASGQITAAGFACLDAAEALFSIGSRFEKTNKWIATGDELGKIRTSVQYLSELLNIAPRGTVITAMDSIRRHMIKQGVGFSRTEGVR